MKKSIDKLLEKSKVTKSYVHDTEGQIWHIETAGESLNFDVAASSKDDAIKKVREQLLSDEKLAEVAGVSA